MVQQVIRVVQQVIGVVPQVTARSSLTHSLKLTHPPTHTHNQQPASLTHAHLFAHSLMQPFTLAVTHLLAHALNHMCTCPIRRWIMAYPSFPVSVAHASRARFESRDSSHPLPLSSLRACCSCPPLAYLRMCGIQEAGRSVSKYYGATAATLSQTHACPHTHYSHHAPYESTNELFHASDILPLEESGLQEAIPGLHQHGRALYSLPTEILSTLPGRECSARII